MPEGTLPLAYRPFLRHWLNTAFYTAQELQALADGFHDLWESLPGGGGDRQEE